MQINNYEFSPDSDENVRIRLAKLAYNTHQYNFNDIITNIKSIKKHLKITHRKYLLGMLNYYKFYDSISDEKFIKMIVGLKYLRMRCTNNNRRIDLPIYLKDVSNS